MVKVHLVESPACLHKLIAVELIRTSDYPKIIIGANIRLAVLIVAGLVKSKWLMYKKQPQLNLGKNELLNQRNQRNLLKVGYCSIENAW